jgi:hypothetical protein
MMPHILFWSLPRLKKIGHGRGKVRSCARIAIIAGNIAPPQPVVD